MSDKRKEGRRQHTKRGEEEKDVQEVEDDRRECSDTDEEEKMQSFLSEEANRQVRDKYWELMTVVHQHTDEQKSMDTHSLQLLVLEANEAFDAVKRPREAAIDAQLLKVCGNMAKLNIETSQSGLAVFKPREFAEKLISFALKEDENVSEDNEEELTLITKLGKKASHLFNSVHGVEPFFSAVEWERPEVQRKSRQKKDSEEATRVAKKVAEVTGNDGEEESEAVSWMVKVLKKCYVAAQNKPLPFFNFIVDPNSFSRTVENLFHVSLLIREQYAEIIEDEDGLPVILPTQSIASGTHREEKQCILSLDMKEWKEIIKAFKITSSMIPPMQQPSRKRK